MTVPNPQPDSDAKIIQLLTQIHQQLSNILGVMVIVMVLALLGGCVVFFR